MISKKSIKMYLTHPVQLLVRIGKKSFLKRMDDESYLKMLFKDKFGRELNLENPKTFNEKLQWLKLYDRNPLYTELVDKYEVRKHIAAKIGEEYLIPLVGGPWDSFDEIDFEKLPDQFVLKCTHDSGGLVVCRDKSKLDIAAARKKIQKCLQRNYYWNSREWPYKNVKPRIIAEQYMNGTQAKELRDYKLMCFSGRVECSFVCSDRFSNNGLHVTFFDRDWKMLPFERKYPSKKEGFPKPLSYEKMISLAEILSASVPFVRVDLYEIDGCIYFGELTFYPGSGFEEFTPIEWDGKLGDWIELPAKKCNSGLLAGDSRGIL